jgi:DNA-binding MarR family transcriptional regulator
LKQIIAYIDNGERRLLNQFNLTVPRYYALKHIHENPGISLTDLSALMLNDKSNTSRLIRNIQEAGLTIRCRSESDRRTSSLYLSESGEQLFERASAAHEIYTKDRFSGLNADVEVLLDHLLPIKRTLEQESDGEEQRRW